MRYRKEIEKYFICISFFQELISDLAKYQEMIETTVDMEQANQGEYVIKPDFDETLAGNLPIFLRIGFFHILTFTGILFVARLV